MLLGDLNPTTTPFKQSMQILDRANRVVVADDTNSGNGACAMADRPNVAMVVSVQVVEISEV